MARNRAPGLLPAACCPGSDAARFYVVEVLGQQRIDGSSMLDREPVGRVRKLDETGAGNGCSQRPSEPRRRDRVVGRAQDERGDAGAHGFIDGPHQRARVERGEDDGFHALADEPLDDLNLLLV